MEALEENEKKVSLREATEALEVQHFDNTYYYLKEAGEEELAKRLVRATFVQYANTIKSLADRSDEVKQGNFVRYITNAVRNFATGLLNNNPEVAEYVPLCELLELIAAAYSSTRFSDDILKASRIYESLFEKYGNSSDNEKALEVKVRLESLTADENEDQEISKVEQRVVFTVQSFLAAIDNGSLASIDPEQEFAEITQIIEEKLAA